MPGKPSESLLVRKLKGMAGDRMPLNKPALPDDVIAKFEKWVATGARFDGPDPAVPREDRSSPSRPPTCWASASAPHARKSDSGSFDSACQHSPPR